MVRNSCARALVSRVVDRMLLNGILFRRHFGALDNIGNLQQNQ